MLRPVAHGILTLVPYYQLTVGWQHLTEGMGPNPRKAVSLLAPRIAYGTCISIGLWVHSE